MVLDKPVEQPAKVTPSAAGSAPPAPSFNHAQLDEVPPPPPPEPDAGPVKSTRVASSSGTAGCEPKVCAGAVTSELETALAFRAKQAHRCYDQALTQDNTLQGKVQISVRIAPSGNVCNVGVASNDMGTPVVAQCVAGYFKQAAHFPSPKGGCLDTVVPISFVPGGR
ncbi:AgmX/PglI C-terminal domain-containing protein [Pendulispora albinea]|uniref:AgmX/PglI C-terminal domain-containing protein n=1 Tax=Pendulispora albinea TaxID=2741071 RepID=A0ABZ2M2G0_9BACT